jgi:hypothetical protein
MKELTFVEALRYVFSGVIAFAFYAFLDPVAATAMSKTLGPIGLPLVLAVGGTLIYFVYRPLLYNLIIHPLHGVLRGTRSNHLKLMQKQYSHGSRALSRLDAISLFRQLVATHLRPEHDRLAADTAGTHMTYMAGLLAVGFAVVAHSQGDLPARTQFAWGGIILLVCGCLMDWRLERMETDMVLQLGTEKRDQVAASLGFTASAGRSTLP